MKFKPFVYFLASFLFPFLFSLSAWAGGFLPSSAMGREPVTPYVCDTLLPVPAADTVVARQPSAVPASLRQVGAGTPGGRKQKPEYGRRWVEAHRGAALFQHTAQRYRTQLDSLALINRAEGSDSLSGRIQRTNGMVSLHLLSPYAFLPLSGPTFYPSALSEAFSLRSAVAHFPSSSVASRRVYDLYHYSQRALCEVYRDSPDLITYEEASSGTLDVEGTIREGLRPERSLTERYEGRTGQPASNGGDADGEPSVLPGMPELNVVVRKPCFWTFKANVAMQFTQNYVSDNWYKGGESNYVMLGSTVLEANYDNRQRLTFDNRLEMKLGFQTVAHDDEHNFRTSSDQLRLTNKLGLRAVKHWYYTVMLQSWTQFCRGYKANDPKIYSDFMSPFESLLTVGMDYKVASKNNAFQLNATLSPLAVDLKYVNRPSLVTAFGVNEGHHSAWSWGSNVTVNYSWQIAKTVKWSGRFYWFTNYEKTQLEWENTFDFAITTHLSTRLFLYPRYDDSVQRKEGDSYFQFYELFSLGFNYNF